MSLLPGSKICLLWILILTMACKADDPSHDEYWSEHIGQIDKVLIIGNSITKHPPAEEFGWEGDWGMAASDISKDFVHVVMDSVHEYESNVEFMFTGKGVVFEKEYATYNVDQEFADFKAFEADLIIIRLGENVDDADLKTDEFQEYFTEFVEYLKAEDNTPVLVATSFWAKENTTKAMVMASESNQYHIIHLDDLFADNSNAAFGEYESYHVQIHPNDKGMRLIAERIWTEIGFLFTKV